MDFSYLENENVQYHVRLLDEALASGMDSGAVGHIANQLNQAIVDAQNAPSTQTIMPRDEPAPAPAPGPSYSPPPPPPPTPPNPWITTRTFTPPPGVKQADPDIVLDPEIDTTGDYIVERFFEELGGTELIDLSRYDLIDGIDVTYRPIANLSRLRQRFNPNNIISLDVLSQAEFSRFSIDLISRGIYEPYFDNDGNLIVEIDIIRQEENIDVQISESGTVTRIEL
jgi:hypothetical protein